MDIAQEKKEQMRNLLPQQKITILKNNSIENNQMLEEIGTYLEILKKPSIKMTSEFLKVIRSVSKSWLGNFFLKGGWDLVAKAIEKKENARSGKDIVILTTMLDILIILLNEELGATKVKDFSLVLTILRVWRINDLQIKKKTVDILEFITDQPNCHE